MYMLVLPAISLCLSLTTLEVAVQVQADLAGKVPRSFVEISGWAIYWGPYLGGKQI